MIGGLFKVAEALESESTVVFETTCEPEPEVSETRRLMARLLVASPACTHRGTKARH